MTRVSAASRKAISRSPCLRALVKSAASQNVIQTLRAIPLLTPSHAFARRQLLGSYGRTARYQLRPDSQAIYIRHRTRDIAILGEIFGRRCPYEPPQEVKALLVGPMRVLDLGGNIGMFGAYVLRHLNVTNLRSYEPDPSNLTLLCATAMEHKDWQVIPKAASNTNGTIKFLAGQFSESRAAEAGENGVTVPVVDVFSESPCDLMKIDIEGAEWPILADPRIAGAARVIVLEWHSRGCPDRDAHGTARRLLSDAGYCNQYDEPREHDFNGVLWAWR